MKISIQDIKKFSLFDVLGDEELGQIQQAARIHKLGKDEVLFLEGESANALYFVLEGWLKAEKVSREGRQQTLRLIGPGEIVNELSVFSNESSSVSVVAMEPVIVFSLPQSEIEQRLMREPSFSRAVIKNMAQRIQHLLNHIENLSLYPVEVRLARLLLDEEKDGVVLRPSWKTQTEIANQLGTVLDVVNRNFQKLTKEGLIEFDRDHIKILNREGLEQIARG